MYKALLVCLAIVFIPAGLSGQTASPDSTKGITVSSLFGLPIAYYSPETRWAGGLAGLMAFRFRSNKPEGRPSQVQLGFAYTQERQFLSYLPFTLFLKNEAWYIYGELGYYRYTYFFYGLGNSDPKPDGELYDVNFPRMRVHGLRRVLPGWYLGWHHWLDVFAIADVEPGGLLADPQLDIPGRSGGVISATGLISLLDRREELFSPESGYYVENLLQVSGRATGADFRYARFTTDARLYLPVWRKQHHVLALNAYADVTTGEAPFNALPSIGGNKRMRGFYEGRFRDNNLVLVQAEYRLPLFWRLGMVGFASAGSVFSDWRQQTERPLRLAAGGGLRVRISRNDRLNIRVDAAFAKGSSGYYVTVGEAF